MGTKEHRLIVVDIDKCTGCHGCEMACSMQHFHLCSPLYSRVRIQEFRDVNTFVPVLCQACEDAPCIKSCPVNARVRLENGAVVTDEDRCIGCKTCIFSCRFGAVFPNPETGLPMSCDLCHGEPAGPRCVEACTMQRALLYVDSREAGGMRSREWAGIVKKGFSLPGEEDDLSFEATGYGSSSK
jgi:Fe-S-cluster-containing hydrogenase component 2